MELCIVVRDGERDLRFQGEQLSSVTKYSIFAKKTEYVLYRTAGSKFVCQQIISFLSVRSLAVVVTHLEDIDVFFGTKVARELIFKAGLKYHIWID